MIQSRFFIVCLFVVLMFAMAASVAWGVARAILDRPTQTTETQYYYIAPGNGLLRASYVAEQQGLVAADWHFRLAARLLGMERRLQAGEYELAAGIKLTEVFSKIGSGDRYMRRLVVPEGRSVAEVEAILKASFGLDMTGYTRPPEGSLLPDTYFYERGDSAKNLIGRMQAALWAEVDRLWPDRDNALPIQSPDEAIILASIVEKETAVASERPLVAAVFVNRLKRGMRLQSDPTVIYGITNGEILDRPILRSDLSEVTPYNTYRVGGLPPTPIANPGKASIEAVLKPADVSYLYFVADGSGGHAFANTLQEHNRNVARWRQIEAKSRR